MRTDCRPGIAVNDGIEHVQYGTPINTLILMYAITFTGVDCFVSIPTRIVSNCIVVEGSLLNINTGTARVLSPTQIVGKKRIITRTHQHIDTTTIIILIITIRWRGISNAGIQVINKETTDNS